MSVRLRRFNIACPLPLKYSLTFLDIFTNAISLRYFQFNILITLIFIPTDNDSFYIQYLLLDDRWYLIVMSSVVILFRIFLQRSTCLSSILNLSSSFGLAFLLFFLFFFGCSGPLYIIPISDYNSTPPCV